MSQSTHACRGALQPAEAWHARSQAYLEGEHAQLLRQGAPDLQGLDGHRGPLVGLERVAGAHVVQAVRQLDGQPQGLVCQADHHVPQGFSLLQGQPLRLPQAAAGLQAVLWARCQCLLESWLQSEWEWESRSVSYAVHWVISRGGVHMAAGGLQAYAQMP